MWVSVSRLRSLSGGRRLGFPCDSLEQQEKQDLGSDNRRSRPAYSGALTALAMSGILSGCGECLALLVSPAMQNMWEDQVCEAVVGKL